MTKYKITMEVESFLTPEQLLNSDFTESFASDISTFLKSGIEESSKYDGCDENLVKLEDETFRFFQTRYSKQALETHEKEQKVDFRVLGIREEDIPKSGW